MIEKYMKETAAIPFENTTEKTEFIELSATHGLNEQVVNFEAYKQLLALTRYACNQEQKGLSQADEETMAVNQAFKLSTLFGNYGNAVEYLKRFENGQKKTSRSTQLVHDACLFSLPPGDLALWRGLVLHYRPNKPEDKLMQLLPLSKEIEDYVVSHKTEILDKFRAELAAANARFPEVLLKAKAKQLLTTKTPIATLLGYANSLCYARASENPGAAAIFFANKMPESAFNQYLGLRPEDSEAIPNITIDGATLSPDYADYYLKKLAPDDPRAALLGKYTSCCQSLEDHGRTSAIYGITDEKSGFYVLCDKKNDRIMAQCWAWRNAKDDMVFDSVESQVDFRGKNLRLICDMFFTLANDLVQKKNIPVVNVGIGGNTPEELGLNFNSARFALLPNNYNQYSDAENGQRVLMVKNLPLLNFYCRKLAAKGWVTALKTSDFESINYTKEQVKNIIELCAMNDENLPDYPLNWRNFIKHKHLTALGLSDEDCTHWFESALKFKKFLASIRHGDLTLDGISDYLSDFDFDLNHTFSYRQENIPLLALAAIDGNFDLIKFLVAKGSDLQWKSLSGNTLLHYASGEPYGKKSNPMIINFFIKNGVDFYAINYHGVTANIFRDISDLRTFKELVDNSAPSAEEIRLREEYEEKLKEYKESGSEDREALKKIEAMPHPLRPLNCRDKSGLTAMHYAVNFGKEALSYVLLKGGDINTKSFFGYTPFIFAIDNHSLEAVQFFVEHGELNDKNDPLLAAMGADDEGIFKYLLEQGAKIMHESPLLYLFNCSRLNFKKWFLLLLEAGADPKVPLGRDNNSALHLAVQSRKLDLVELLVDKVDINSLNKQQVTPLAEAVKNEDEAIFQYLLKQGAKANIGNPLKSIPLQSPNLVKWFLLLLEAGADSNSPLDKDNNCALHLAVQSGKLDFVQLLAEKGADINCLNEQKRTPLHLACLYGKADIATWLIEKGADTSLLDIDKKTAVQLTTDPEIKSLFLTATLQTEQSSSTYSFFNPSDDSASKIEESKTLGNPGESDGPK